MKLTPIFNVQGMIVLAALLVAALALLGWRCWGMRKDLQARRHFIIRCSIILLVFLMAIGISIPGGTSPPGMLNLDIVFAVDTTASMGAEDYGSKLRLEGVKTDLLAMAERFKGARMTLIGFDSTDHLLLPFTSDTAAFSTAVNTMEREVYAYSSGSSIDQPIKAIQKQLQNSQTAHPKRGRLVFYLGDGEQTASKQPASFASLTPYMNGGLVLGYGTSAGGKIRKFTGYSDGIVYGSPYILEFSKEVMNEVPAVSKINEDNLRQIADQLKVNYEKREPNSNVTKLVTASKAEKIADRSREVTHYQSLYWLFAILATFLIGLESFYVLRIVRRTKDGRHE